MKRQWEETTRAVCAAVVAATFAFGGRLERRDTRLTRLCQTYGKAWRSPAARLVPCARTNSVRPTALRCSGVPRSAPAQ